MSAFDYEDKDLAPEASAIIKEQAAANRNKRYIEKTEKYLSENYDFRRNIVSIDIEYKKKDDSIYLSFDDVAINNLWRQFQYDGIPYSKQKAIDLIKSDFSMKFDPFIDYFERLDPFKSTEPDYIDQLANHIKVNTKSHLQTDFNKHFKKQLVRTVKCAIDERYFNKHAFILVQQMQNGGKSTFIRYLCPPELQRYYTEEIGEDKDGLIALCENFIINMDELSTLNRIEINHLKTMISKIQVKVRPPFEKKAMPQPRRASFFGSTNDMQFLTDPTGSVRWICFEIDTIDWKYTTIPINRVWAQAYHLLNTGFDCQITKEEQMENEHRNREFRVTTVEKEIIIKHFEPAVKGAPTNEMGDIVFKTATDIINFIQNKISGPVRIKPEQIGKVMSELGYTKEQKRVGNNPVRGYYMREYFEHVTNKVDITELPKPNF